MSRSPSWPPLALLAVFGVLVVTLAPRHQPAPPETSTPSRAEGRKGSGEADRTHRRNHHRLSHPGATAAIPPTAPKVEHLIESIAAGIPLRFTTADSPDSKPIYFRPAKITNADFNASLGTRGKKLEIESQRVYRGKSLLGEQQASLAIVNGQLAAHLQDPEGRVWHFRSAPESGEFEAVVEASLDTTCSIAPGGAFATTLSHDPIPADPWGAASPASIEADPETAASSGYNPANGNLQFTDRAIPYGRLYDQSLKDILVLVVLDKGATGSDSTSNLSSKTASYLSIMSNISGMYEHNLGLRIILQELILTPNTSAYTDVAGGSGSLSAFRSWVSSNRSRGTYDWTVAAKFGEVDGSSTLGVAYLSTASGSSGVSINKTGFLTVPAHEIGHNMGSGHSDGGVMNASANNSRDFFRTLSGGTRTSAYAIYNYMSNGGASTQGRAFPSNRRLRHAEEIPFADDDTISTLPNRPIRFRPMANDDTSVPNGLENTLSLFEVGAVFPPGAGEAWIYGDEIEFRPSPGFRSTAWLSYTIRGSVGNGGEGWLHKGDVAIRIENSSTTPPDISSTTATPDFIHHVGGSALVLNPLADDHGPGYLNVDHTTASLGTSGSASPQENGFFISDATLLDPDKGSLAENRVDITLAGGNRVDRTRFLTLTPAAGATGPARIEYTVTDGNGTSTTQTATVLFGTDRILLDAPSPCRFLVPSDAGTGAGWIAESFDDSSWTPGDTGVGYETSSSGTRYDPLIGSSTRSEMFNGGTSIYIRIPFEIASTDDIESLRLQMQYDDGFAAFINGVPITSRNAPSSLSWDASATSNHEASINTFSSYDISSAIGELHPGTNLLAIHGLNTNPGSSDFIIRPRLVATKRFTLGGIDLPSPLSIPSGAGLVLNGYVNGISAPPFAGNPVARWSSPGGTVSFADANSPSTTATFPLPGIHTLRLRLSEAGYVEEHEIEVHAGTATSGSSPLAIAGPDLIIAPDTDTKLSAITRDADEATWTQISGPGASISNDGDVTFSSSGSHRFRLSATDGLVTTFDDVTIVRGTGDLAVTPLGSLARWRVPSSAGDLTDPDGLRWETPGFDDSNWDRSSARFGFERDSGYGSLIGTDLQELMFGNNSSVLTRLRFFSPQLAPATLSLRFEDGFSSYLNGVSSARENAAPPPLSWDSSATGSQSDAQAQSPLTFLLGTANPGSNSLAIQGLNSSAESSDFLLLPELRVSVSSGDPFLARLVTPYSPSRFIVPGAAVPGWTDRQFDDGSWDSSAAALGYERSGSGVFDDHYFSDVEDASFGQNQTTYLRIPFLVPEGFTVRTLTLHAKYDDAFVAHVNGTQAIQSPGAGTPEWDSGAITSRTESLTTVFEPFDLGAVIPDLRPGANVLAIQLLNSGLSSSDLLFVPELVAELDTQAEGAYLQWFQSQPGTAGLDSSPGIDLDGDRLSNLLEFAFGGSPARAEADPITPLIEGGQFKFFRRKNHLPEGISYVVEMSSSLGTGSWVPLSGAQEFTLPTEHDLIEQVLIQLPADAERSFFRLKVELAE